MVNLNWGEIFGRVAATGISDLGKVAEKANSIRATDSPHADSGAAFYIANDRLTKRIDAGSTRIAYVMQKHLVARGLHALSLLAVVVGVFHN